MNVKCMSHVIISALPVQFFPTVQYVLLL